MSRRGTGSGSAAPSTPIAHGAALISWSGSMFEYLMPSLVMRAPAGSLLEQTSRLIVRRQIDYGASSGVPWGISESAYNARDLEFTYQYSNFGVPGLGLKRGLGENVVVAPYATALAAMVDPHAAARNFARLAGVGARGPLWLLRGARLHAEPAARRQQVAIVRAFMAHHQGMTIVAIANALLDGAMRARFHAEPIVQATELLLQERTPRDVAVAPSLGRRRQSRRPRMPELDAPPAAGASRAHGATPRHASALERPLRRDAHRRRLGLQPLARSGRHPLARGRHAATTGAPTSFCATCDSGEVWSAGYQPSGVEPDAYDVVFTEDRAEFIRRDGTLTTTLESSSRPRTTPRSAASRSRTRAAQSREIEVTSYAELVLAPPAADVAHPAFSKLFVQTEYLADVGALLATRRRRSPTEPEVWAAHLAVRRRRGVGEPQIETDRARFLGRGRGVRDADRRDRRPAALQHRRHGARSDLRAAPPRARRARQRRCASPSGRWSPISREAVLDLVDKHHDATPSSGPSTLAWTQAQVQLRHLGIDPERGGPVPASRRPPALCRTGAAAVVRHHPARRRWRSRALAAWASPATCRSCCCGSTTSRISTSCASCCRRTNTGG